MTEPVFFHSLKHFFRRPLLLAALSGFLLLFSFPTSNLGFLAWISLVPLLTAILKSTSLGQALVRGFVTGIVFFTLSLHWLTHVTEFGWIFVSLLQTLFFLPFAWVVYEVRTVRIPLARCLWTAAAWSTFELVRTEIPVFGLGFNLLAYSQADYSWIRQSANTIGAYGLGFVIVFANACLVEMRETVQELKTQCWDEATRLASRVRTSLIQRALLQRLAYVVAALPVIFLLLLSHGFYHVRKTDNGAKTFKIGILQGNIPQEVKWQVVAREKILEIYLKLTELAFYDQPDLVFWPEAAFPGYFNHDREAEKILALVKKFEIPLVVGSPHLEKGITAYNSAYLVESDGAVKARYDKQTLVPFGEYVPLKFIFGWLEPLAYSMGVSNFEAGQEATVFQLTDTPLSFSTLICFEDMFPNLARRFVSKGAELLAVMTNDAWFGRSAAPYQHLQASIFRAIENGVPVIRAANTGVSAFISSQGEVLDRIQDLKGKDIFISGRKVYALPIRPTPTLYRLGGWLFPYLAMAALIVMMIQLKTTDYRPSKSMSIRNN